MGIARVLEQEEATDSSLRAALHHWVATIVVPVVAVAPSSSLGLTTGEVTGGGGGSGTSIDTVTNEEPERNPVKEMTARPS